MLVHGAAGGVGTATLQIAKGLGAQTIAVVSTDEKERVAREAGADEVVRSDGPWKDQAKEISGGGVDVVIDPVGGDRFTDSLRSLREGGRVVVVGFTGGSIPEVRVNRLLLANTEVIGAGWGDYVIRKPELNREIGDGDRTADRAGLRAPGRRRAVPARAGRRRARADRRPRRDRQGRARDLLSARPLGRYDLRSDMLPPMPGIIERYRERLPFAAERPRGVARGGVDPAGPGRAAVGARPASRCG